MSETSSSHVAPDTSKPKKKGWLNRLSWVGIIALIVASVGLVIYGIMPRAVKTPEVGQTISVSPKKQPTTGPTKAKVTSYGTPQINAQGTTEDDGPPSSQTIDMSPAQMAPNHLLVPAIGAYAHINTAGVMGQTTDGSLNLPHPTEVTRWVDGNNVTDSKGNTVLAGHVSWNEQKGVLFYLADIKPGNLAYVTDLKGGVHSYKLVKLVQVSKKTASGASGIPSWVWSKTGPKQLVLITCGGQLIHHNGHSSFEDNTIAVFASVDN